MRFSLVMHESLDFKKRASRWKTPRLRQLQASCGHPLWALWKFASEIFGSLFLAQQHLLLHTSLTWSLSSSVSSTRKRGLSHKISHLRTPENKDPHKSHKEDDSSKKPEKNPTARLLHQMLSQKKKKITLRLERNNNITKKLHEKKLGEKTSKCLAKQTK